MVLVRQAPKAGGIHSLESIPGLHKRQPYLTYRPARLHRLAELLGSLNVYKYGLRKEYRGGE
jgi:hypothetical protein